MALINLETYYSFPDIDAKRNYVKYSPNAGTTWFDFRLPVGCYVLKEIIEAIQRQIKSNGHSGKAVVITANTVTLKTILKLANDYKRDFSGTDSIGTVLGYKSTQYTKAYNESEKLVDILNVNTILVHVDFISCSYLNGTQTPMSYSFFPNVDPGHKIVEKPNHPIYLPIHLKTIRSLRTSLTDQHAKQLDLRGERVTVRYHLREI